MERINRKVNTRKRNTRKRKGQTGPVVQAVPVGSSHTIVHGETVDEERATKIFENTNFKIERVKITISRRGQSSYTEYKIRITNKTDHHNINECEIINFIMT